MRRWQAVPGLQVAIDGPSGSGKGTVAKVLAEEIGFAVVDTGLLYRLTGSLAISRAVALDDGDALATLAAEMLSQVTWTAGGISFGGEEWSGRLCSEAAGAAASQVASQPKVRQQLLGLQRKIAESGCVMDGRDIGTVVLPNAQAKFFLTASVRERARRRWAQLKDQGGSSLDAVVDELKMRDQRDQERQHAPLTKAEDAIAIDSTTMRADDVVERMLGVLERRGLIDPLCPDIEHKI